MVVRIGIVGCGMISEFQALALQQLDGVEVAGFCNRTPEKARHRVEQFGGECYPTLGDMLLDDGLTAVSVCTPSGEHLDAAVKAARAGKHVMVEKPIEVTPERCDEIILACRDAGVVLGAIFPRRFNDTSVVVKNAIDAGRFGTLVHADVHIKWWRDQDYYDSGGWRGTWQLDGGGALMNQGIHGIDLLQWLLGGVESVSAFTGTLAHTGIEVEDVASAAVRFKNGVLGSIQGTTGAWPGSRIRVEVCGTDGHVVMEDEILEAWEFRDETDLDAEIRQRFGSRAGVGSGGGTDPRAIDFEGHRRNFADFVASIRGDPGPHLDGAEGRHAVAIISAIYRSARQSASVDVT
jgi:predicted dehydrogenase